LLRIITSHQDDPSLTQSLSSLYLYRDTEESSQRISFLNLKSDTTSLLAALQTYLPDECFLQPNRLDTLLKQSYLYQKRQCHYHSKKSQDTGILKDHHCEKKKAHFVLTDELRSHSDEVWFVQFSVDGQFLVSSSKDRSVIVWSTEVFPFMISDSCIQFLEFQIA
jgi:WD40 repeat protein